MKKFLALVLALIMTASLVTISAGAEDFSDAEAITYTEAVEVMTAIDVIDGYTDGSFGPAGNLTRGAAAKIICNLILGPTTADALRADAAPYADVAADHVFAPYIAYLAKEGLVSGYADGTFKPAAPLTGYAFMKMLLGVAGYDAEIEGYTGANWSINVAKQGLAIELLDGYKGTFNGTATVNRETAMLMAFNTIQADMVKYDNKSTIVVGDIVVSTNSEEEPAGYTVMEKYFEDLDLRIVADAFGRPANNWWNDKEEIGLYVAEADVSYTNEVEVKTVYAALGLAENHATVTYVNGQIDSYWVDADNDDEVDAGEVTTNFAPIVLTKKGTTKVGAAGQLVEFFYDKDWDLVTAVVIDTYFGEVAQVNEDDVDRTISIAGLDFETEDFEVEDLVLYTVSVDEDGLNPEIQSVVKAEKVEGVEMTKYTQHSGATTEFVGGGKTYSVAAQYDSTDSDLDVIGDVLDVYTDAEGYVYYATATLSAKKYAYILGTGSEADLYGGAAKYFAKYVTTDGKVEEVQIGKIGSADVAPSNYQITGWVEYAQLADGTYKLTAKSTASQTLTEIKTGVAKIDLAGTDYYGNAKTIYVVQGGTAPNYTYTVYTGHANVPSMKTGTASYVLDGSIAQLVFIGGTTISGGGSYIYIDGTSTSGKISDANGDYYVYPAIIDGEIKTVYVDTEIKDGSNNKIDVMLNNVIYNEYGVIDWAKTSGYAFPAIGADPDCYAVTGATIDTKLTDGVIDTSVDSYTVADDVKAFAVTDNSLLGAADTIAATSAKTILDTVDQVDYIVEDGAITVIIATTVKQPA